MNVGPAVAGGLVVNMLRMSKLNGDLYVALFDYFPLGTVKKGVQPDGVVLAPVSLLGLLLGCLQLRLRHLKFLFEQELLLLLRLDRLLEPSILRLGRLQLG